MLVFYYLNEMKMKVPVNSNVALACLYGTATLLVLS